MTDKEIFNNNTINQSENVRLDFWDFEALRDPSKKVEKRSAFPIDRIVTEKEMNFYFDKVMQRMSKYKTSSCFNYLEAFHNFNKKVYYSKSEEEINENYYNSLKCLKLFTFCWEMERTENKDEGNVQKL